MSTSISLYDYILPTERIAQTPAIPRESAKLMTLDRTQKTIGHNHVSDLPLFFRKGDVLVINNTKVFRARLHGTIEGKSVELFLVRPLDGSRWLALGKPGKKIAIGKSITIQDDFVATVFEKRTDGTLIVGFNLTPTQTIAQANKYGTVPIPPYIKTIPDDKEYQTSFAKREGSVAAPTAGFHFTAKILATLQNKGVEIIEITLHVGLGTFLPIKSDTLEEHTIHTEWVDVSSAAAEKINQAKNENRRIVAVGTTTVRTLEGVAALHNGHMHAYQGEIGLFITPGFNFSVIDGMVTNFHLPKSTLLVLVSAFAKREFILEAYNQAVQRNYRFYSFGDAMLIV
jgi:S-adenosylmethionine:tRNA ribosyltransferase-isomerase